MTTRTTEPSNDPEMILAEHYYTVAKDLEANAREQLQVAARLARHADMLCEQSMRRKQPEDAK